MQSFIPKPPPVNNKNETLDGLLFSNSVYDDEDSIQNQSREHSKSISKIDFIRHKEEGFLLDNQDQYMNEDEDFKFAFPTVNAPSIQFSQHSLMMSKRYDEQSRNQKNRRNKQYLNDRNNEAYEKKISELENKIENKQLQIEKLQGLNHGMEAKLKKKQEQIADLQEQIKQLEEKKFKFENEKSELLKRINSKDQIFMEINNQCKAYLTELREKEEIIRKQEEEIVQISQDLEAVKKSVAIYSDRELTDFGSKTNFTQNKLSNSNMSAKQKTDASFYRQLQHIKKSLKVIEDENQILKNQIFQKDQKIKSIEDSLTKKIQSKDKKIKQAQDKLLQSSEALQKIKEKSKETEERIRQQLAKKSRQLKEAKESQLELEKRVKNFIQQQHRRQQRSKQLNIELIEKNKEFNQMRKELQEIKINQEFEQHMIKEKQEQIEEYQSIIQKNKKLINEYEAKQESQKNGLNRIEKEKEKELNKYKKDNEKFKKQFEELKTEYDRLIKQKEEEEDIKNKENQQKEHLIKDYKKKYDQTNKKLTQTKNKLSQSQSKLVEQQKMNHELQQQNDSLNQEHEKLLKLHEDLKTKYKQTEEKNRQNIEISGQNKEKQLMKNKSSSNEVKKLADQLKRVNQINKNIEEEKNQALNKLIILEAKFKESIEHENTSYNEDEQLKEKFEALQELLVNKQEKIKDYQAKLKELQSRLTQRHFEKSVDQSIDYLSTSQIQQAETLESQIYLRDEQIQKLSLQICQKQQLIERFEEQLQRKQNELSFKQKSIEFLHKKILDIEREKMELQAEKKMLEESFYNIDHDSQEEEFRVNAYKKQMKSLEKQINIYKNKLLEKDQIISKLQEYQKMNTSEANNQYKFEIRDLKKRLKELSELAISKDRKLTPESLSQDETVQFLIKTIKKAPKSMDMIRILSQSDQFREGIYRIEKAIEKFIKGVY